MQIEDFIVPSDCSVIDAMKQIDRNVRGIVYVCEDGRITGSLTDGDIRRFILKNGDLGSSVGQIANRRMKALTENEKDKAQDVMRENGIRSVPVLDRHKRLREIYFEEGVCREKQQLHLPLVIMAGGKGTRLHPYTRILPKPLIPVGEKTITEHIIGHFAEYGCTQVDMIINYKKNLIKAYFMDHEVTPKIHFVEEKEYLGTAGGLKLLEGRYESAFFMSNCDILVEEDYSDIVKFHRKQENMVTMVCAVKQVGIPYGTVEVSSDGCATAIHEKPEVSFITNTGLYLLEPEFLKHIPDHTFIHITDVIQKCIESGKRIGVYPVSEQRWLDMGQMDELKKMQSVLENRV